MKQKEKINLTLVLKHKYFEMTGEEGKMYELRTNSEWIRSRILSPKGGFEPIQFVMLQDTYAKGAKTKCLRLKKITQSTQRNLFVLPNGENIYSEPGDYVIWLEKLN